MPGDERRESEPVPATLDAAQVIEAHAAAYAGCEPWLQALEQLPDEVRGAQRALSSLEGKEREAYVDTWKTHLEQFLDATRQFASSVEDALKALPKASREPEKERGKS